MKKFLSLILIMVLSVTQITVAFGTYAQTNSESDLVGEKFPECDLTWSFNIETGLLTLEGNGEMVFSGNAPWSAYKKEIKNVVVGEGITYLEGSLFYYISFDKIILPSTLEYVDSSVFHYAEFNELEIPSENNLRVLDSYSYSGLDGTEWYKNQPDGCVYMGDFLFDYKGTAPDNTTVKIKDGTRAINRNAFQSQSGIVDFEFCDSLERIGYKALDNTGWYDSKPNNSVIYAGNILYKLKGSSYYDSLTVKEGTVSIAEYAVYYKTIYNNYAYYETIYFPSSLKYIDDCAFALNDLFLEEIVFAPGSQLEYIGEKAFGYNTVYFSGDTQKNNDFVIYGHKDTAAERYATENGFKFVDLDAPVPSFELGDVNRDGSVNIKDATAIQKNIAGLIEFDTEQNSLADFNEDASVNIKDATAIQKKIAGLI